MIFAYIPVLKSWRLLSLSLASLPLHQALIARRKVAVPISAITQPMGDCQLLQISSESESESESTRSLATLPTLVIPFSEDETSPTSHQKTEVTAELAFEACSTRKA